MTYLTTFFRARLLYLFSSWFLSISVVAVEPPIITLAPCCFPGASAEFDLLADRTGWKWVNEQAWNWQGDGAERELHLVAQSGAKPTFRSPFNLAWYELLEWKDFTLTCEAQMTNFTKGNNDLCIAFGKVEDYRFYYAHLGEKSDAVHHQIHVVDNADRKPITTFRTSGILWQPEVWHHIRVVRNSEVGDIAVYDDQQAVPVLTARDRTLTWGRIGLGSFDDLGKFRNVKIQGISRTKE